MHAALHLCTDLRWGGSQASHGTPCPQATSYLGRGNSSRRHHFHFLHLPISAYQMPDTSLQHQKSVLLWELTDNCQSLPPHRARDHAEAPSSRCCQADSPPGSLLANPVWQGANWDLSDSTQYLESHFVLPPGRVKRRRREPAEGICILPSPCPPAVLQANYQHYRERSRRGRKWGF